LGIEAAIALTRPPKKGFELLPVGKMVTSSSSHPMLNPASNGICDLSANPTTTLQITSAPCADPRTIHSSRKCLYII